MSSGLVYLLRASIWKLIGIGHARPIKLSLAITLGLFFFSLTGILMAGLVF
jgi:hypothetical protein